MRRKVLQGVVNNFSGMFEGWRAYEYQETLLELSQGQPAVLTINVLTGDCAASGATIPPLSVALQMQDWFAAQLACNDIPRAGIQAAELRVTYQANLWQVPMGRLPLLPWIAAFLTRKPRVRFYREIAADFDCRAVVRTLDCEYASANGRSAKGSPTAL